MNPEENPYQPPRSLGEMRDSSSPISPSSVLGTRTGPAIYVALGGMISGFPASNLLVDRNAIGLALPILGCLFGGLVFRYRSRKWPVHPNARQRQVGYAILATVMIAIIVIATTGARTQAGGIVAIGAIVGLSLAIGMLVSGGRRFGNLG